MLREEWEAGEAPVGRGENRVTSVRTCLVLKLSMVRVEAHRDRTMGWLLGYRLRSALGVRRD